MGHAISAEVTLILNVEAVRVTVIIVKKILIIL